MITHKNVDAVTVGAGWSAGVLAQKLTAAGLTMVSIERGPERYAHPDYAHNHDSIRNSVRKKMMQDLERESWTWRPNPSSPALPMRQYGSFHPGAGIGGSGAHWSGMHWRFLPSDFRYRTHYTERYGANKLPAGNRIRDWPLTYEELEPYYTQVDFEIGVSGQAGNLRGALIDGGNIFEGPRSKPYPLPPLEATKPSLMFETACKELGYHPFPQPAGILSRAYVDISGRERSGCLYCGFCTRFGCEVDAKASAGTSLIPLALATGRYEIRTECTATRVATADTGLATGVVYMDRERREHFQPADMVFLTAYTLSNVRLMLLSRSAKHPNGLGNNHGLVGKNYTYQLWEGPVTGVFEGEPMNLYMGNTSTIKVIYDFNADDFDHSNVDFVGGAQIFSCLGEREPVTAVGDLPISNESGATMPADRNWGQPWKDALRKNWDSFVPITIQGESLPYDDQFFDLDPTYTDQYGLPLLRLTFDWHDNDQRLYRFIAQRCQEIMRAMNATKIKITPELGPYDYSRYQSTHVTGGAIMGTDAGNSVANSYGQLWDTPNVFVAGAALYPQNAGANPTGTLLALAYRTAEAIKQKYLKTPDKTIG